MAGFKLLSLVVVLLTTNILFVKAAPARRGESSLFIFGDSFYEVGNNIYINTSNGFLANFAPYGETFFNYPTGRFCDGCLISDFIAEYANLPVIPPYLQPGNHEFEYGANFASSGAGALPETYAGLVISLETQLTYFRNVKGQLVNKLGEKKAKQLLSNAVYLISIGSNDYLRPYVINTSSTVFRTYSHGEYVNMVIGNLTNAIKEIYEGGGRKFGLLNLGPLGCFPYGRVLNPDKIGDCIEELGVLVNLHNVALSKTLQRLGKELNGFLYSVFNFYAAATDRANRPQKYGFKEGKSACCGSGPYRGEISCGGKRGSTEYELCPNPSEYVLFDFVHPTEKANKQYSEIMWSGGVNMVRPYNLKQLFEYTQQCTPSSSSSVVSITRSVAPI